MHAHSPDTGMKNENATFAVITIKNLAVIMLNFTNFTLANATALLENVDFEQLRVQVEHHIQDISPETILVYLYLAFSSWRMLRSVFTFSTIFVVLSSVVAYVTTMQAKVQWKFAALIAWGVVSANGFCPSGKKASRYSKIIPQLALDVLALIYFGFRRRGLLAFGLGVVCGYYVLPWARVVDRLFQWSVWLAIVVAVLSLVMLGGLGATFVKDEL